MAKNSTEEAPIAKASHLRRVRNRNNYKIELLIDGKIIIFPPKKAVKVPSNFELPEGLGLYFA